MCRCFYNVWSGMRLVFAARCKPPPIVVSARFVSTLMLFDSLFTLEYCTFSCNFNHEIKPVVSAVHFAPYLTGLSSIHDKCQGIRGRLPDLELPPKPLPLSLFLPWFTAFIIKSNCAENYCFIKFNIMFHVLEFEIGIQALNACIDK